MDSTIIKEKKIRIDKKQPIFRIPKSWIDPEEERRIKIPVLITYRKDTITITKQTEA